jgi:hypothetical protein
MRYLGQSDELEVPLEFAASKTRNAEGLWARLHELRAVRYGFDTPGSIRDGGAHLDGGRRAHRACAATIDRQRPRPGLDQVRQGG